MNGQAALFDVIAAEPRTMIHRMQDEQAEELGDHTVQKL